MRFVVLSSALALFLSLTAAQPSLADVGTSEARLITDMPEREAEFRALIEKAAENTRAFFGELNAEPTWVICATQQCRSLLGINAAGLAFGAHGVAISPTGINETIVTHERVHIALHGYYTARDYFNPRFPIWFDEGLASHISGDPRLIEPEDPREADWIKGAGSVFEWRKMSKDEGWRSTYGAARRLVLEIEEIAGREGLRDLVERVGQGADFATEYKALLQN